MKTTQYIPLAFIAGMLTISSCQEVIDIELNEADKQLVIDGYVVEGSDSAVVRLSRTRNFFDTSIDPGISDASVTLTLSDGSEVALAHTGGGVYKAFGLTFPTESTYALEVNSNGNTYNASSYMMPSVTIDSLESEFQEGFFGGDDGYNVFVHFQDQPGKNYYRLICKINGELQNEADDIQVFDDNLNDGNPIRIPIFTQFFEPGDSVDVELISLDPDVYEFYQTFAAVASEDAGSPFSAAPANPETNIEGGALGVFAALTSSKRSIRVPQ